ncbi:hypothetical protein TNCV_1864691 [Trichonephila clavipes]|nr:hypothetical protein TNCV_1864691 [Trichonephila clavipes]
MIPWRSIGRFEAGQSHVDVARWLQEARRWFPGYGINLQTRVLSPGRSTKIATKHRHLHRIATWHALSARRHRRTTALQLAVSGRKISKHSLQSPCRDWPLHVASSLLRSFEKPYVVELKKNQ